jgi:hypothetical protein
MAPIAKSGSSELIPEIKAEEPATHGFADFAQGLMWD